MLYCFYVDGLQVIPWQQVRLLIDVVSAVLACLAEASAALLRAGDLLADGGEVMAMAAWLRGGPVGARKQGRHADVDARCGSALPRLRLGKFEHEGHLPLR